MRSLLFMFLVAAGTIASAQIVHPKIGTSVKSDDGRVTVTLIGKKIAWSSSDPNTYDADIHSPKSVNVHPSGKKFYVNSLEGAKTVSYAMDGFKKLAVINFHLEAYDSGEGNVAQGKRVLEIMTEEYNKGNYVIAGGDFNQSFPGTLEVFPVKNPDIWSPGIFDTSLLPEGWQLVYDGEHATCRLLNRPYDPSDPATQYFIIDGFLVSPGVEVVSVNTIDAGFEYSDHNPVRLNIKLQ